MKQVGRYPLRNLAANSDLLAHRLVRPEGPLLNSRDRKVVVGILELVKRSEGSA